MKRVAIVCNPVSGRGKSKLASERLMRLLQNRNCSVLLQETTAHYNPEELIRTLSGCDAVVVAGGDGTIMGVLRAAAEMKLPLYAMPTGNQSLFASLFGMTDRAETVADAIATGRVEEHYYASVNGIPFFHMVSWGLDANVIEKVASSRTSTISNRRYIRPALESIFCYNSPTIDLEIAGKSEIRGQKGYLIIANSPAYACGLNPVSEASSLNAELTARFFPGYGRTDFIGWGLSVILQKSVTARNSLLFTGTQMTVRTTQPVPVQADGEYLGRLDQCSIAHSGTMLRVLRNAAS